MCAYNSPCTTSGSYNSKDYISYGQSINRLYTGAALDCDVNGDGTYDSSTERFYYISDYYDTETKTFDSNYATLVYYDNVADGLLYDYLDENLGYFDVWDNGPRAVRDKLPTTEEWSNVVLKDTTRNILEANGTTYMTGFNYEGYAARLLTYQEIKNGCYDETTAITSSDGLNTNCLFLFENTSYSYDLDDSEPDGYWIENVSNIDGDTAYYVDSYYRRVDYNSIYDADTDSTDYEGVRPVIDVPKGAIKLN